MRVRILVLGTALVFGLAACGGSDSESGGDKADQQRTGKTTTSVQSAASIKISQSSLGPILTDEKGRTLYAFLNDKNGASSCVDQCIATWPALVSRQEVIAGAGIDKSLLSKVKRTEGTEQTVYGDWPLYYYVGDMQPGDVDGQGVDKLWFVVKADGKLIKTVD